MNCKHVASTVLNEFSFQQIPGAIVWKDINSTILNVNTEYANLFGFKKPDDAMGKTDYDLPCKAAEYANNFKMLDQEALIDKIPVTALEIYPYSDFHIKIYVTKRNLFFDQNGNVVGTVCHGTELSNTLLSKISLLFKNQYTSHKNSYGSYILGGHYGKHNLSKRESECLFYLIRGKTAKEVAQSLRLSHRTVEYYIANIKQKFSCNSKSQLIEAAINAGFMSSVPNGMIVDDTI